MNSTPKPSSSRLWLQALESVNRIEGANTETFGDVLNELAARFSERVALIDENSSITYRELACLTNRYSSWVSAHRFEPGGVVALIMYNCAEYVAIWAGLSRAGLTVALINTNLTGAALSHSIRISKCHSIIVGSPLYGHLASIDLGGVNIWIAGESGSGSAPSIDQEISSLSAAEPIASAPSKFPAILIYTSGTTGLPKAANVSHGRVLQWSYWFAGMMETTPADRLYNCLPMYHSVGGICAIGAVLVHGGSVVIRTRFSASRFWDDICASGSTIFQYIGELCRYLLQTKPCEQETQHSLRLCVGNGLRGDVWLPFETRFNIPRILEFYAATEGSFSLYNCEGKPGAIGRVPSFLSQHVPLKLVQYDSEAEVHRRDASGFCLPCGIDDVGEALGRLDPNNDAAGQRFEGYSDVELSEKKLLRNVFKVGDVWYRTGDLMRRDKEGFYYFVDRLGDTFRWKGENVSASEVGGIISQYPGVVDAFVYGVKLPHSDGRAGMAALSTSAEFDIQGLWQHIHDQLPTYACPIFIRLCTAIDRTATFKLSGTQLKSEGLSSMSDTLLMDHRNVRRYVVVTDELRMKIEQGLVAF